MSEGFSGKRFTDFLRRKPRQREGDKFLSSQRQVIQKAKASVANLFNVLSTEEVDELLIEAFLSHGRTKQDFKRLGERLDKRIREVAEIKGKRKEDAEKQQKLQAEPFYRLGLAIAYGAHRPQHGNDGKKLKKEIEELPKEIKTEMLRRLKNGEVPKPLKVYPKETIQNAITWLTSEIVAS